MNNHKMTRRERYAVKTPTQKLGVATATAITLATIATGTTKASADSVQPTTSTPEQATPSTQPDEKAQATANYDAAKASEAQKLADAQAQQKAQEEATAKANAEAEAAKQAANEKAQADAQAQQKATDEANAQEAAQKAAEQEAANQAAQAQAQKDAEVAQQAEIAKQQQEAADFAAQQAKETGSAQEQRDAVTAQNQQDIANAQAAKAAQDATIEANAKAEQDAAKGRQDEANKLADATQKADTTTAQIKQADETKAQTEANTKAEANQTHSNVTSEKASQATVDAAQKTVNNSSSKTVKPAIPANPYDDNAFNEEHLIEEEGNLPTHISDPHIPASHVNDAGYYDYYPYSGENDTTAKINGDATTAQQAELSDYAMTLINSYRTANGKSAGILSTNNQKAVDESVKYRKEAGAGFTHTQSLGSSATTKTTQAYADLNLFNNSENMGVSSLSELTMLSAKTALLNMITAMIYQDGAHGNGHLRNFMTNDLRMAFALQQSTAGDYPYIFIFQGSEINDKSNPANADDQPLTLKSAAQIEAARGGNNDAAVKALVAAQTSLEQLQKDNAKKLADVRINNKQALDNINTKYAKIIADITTSHDATIANNATSYANDVAQIKALATAQHNDNATKLAETLATLKDNYDAKLANIKDVPADELAAKKASDKAKFEQSQVQALADFKADQAKAESALETKLANDLATFKAQLDADVASKAEAGAKNLDALKASNDKAYNDLVAANAQALANLKDSNAKSYAKAQADSQAYLDSINPANAKPATPNKPADKPTTETPSKTDDGVKPSSVGSMTLDEYYAKLKETAINQTTGASNHSPKSTTNQQTSTNNDHTTQAYFDRLVQLDHSTLPVGGSNQTTNNQANVVTPGSNNQHNDNVVYDASAKVLNTVTAVQNKKVIATLPSNDAISNVPQSPVDLPKTGVESSKSLAVLVGMVGLLGISVYVPKHMKNKRV
ncbi:SEC10/PgrA surface exclusion domain-containing protein [Leuconostoc kimchii]|uniref:Surface exclusion protein PrgA n=2 Tax=Leuconostoc kimchii TaxID=136609 RepID=D5T2T0_LEUKI|nr:SEC10/PgrA surface exclusion domain-containing protein [Leuconostoc kimchii]ADG40579.1 surface exclusion protein PrgA [Leuconostoc kimchii IMSNU 11154]QBR47042.1 SEC10/PgrA surface exclusion domain-containing protein [Leuconostoc kimchii]